MAEDQDDTNYQPKKLKIYKTICKKNSGQREAVVEVREAVEKEGKEGKEGKEDIVEFVVVLNDGSSSTATTHTRLLWQQTMESGWSQQT